MPAGSSVGKVGIFVPAGHDEAWALYSGGPWRLRPFFRQEGVKELCEEMHRSETRRWTFASKSKRLLHVYVARARNSRRSRESRRLSHLTCAPIRLSTWEPPTASRRLSVTKVRRGA